MPCFCLLISCKRCWFRYCCWQIQKFYTLKFFLAIFPNNKTAFISIKMILVLALLILKLMCKNWIVLGKKVCENIPIKWVNFIILHKLSKGTHCFLKNLQKKFHTTAGRDGRDKFQVCLHQVVIDQWGNEKFLEHTSQSSGHKTG